LRLVEPHTLATPPLGAWEDTMRVHAWTNAVLGAFASIAGSMVAGCSSSDAPVEGVRIECDGGADAACEASAACLGQDPTLIEGKRTFRFDTFGDEAFWSGALKLNTAIAGAGGDAGDAGAGSGLTPKAALKLGLKVDAEALPADLVQQLRAGQVNLDDPATTLALIGLDAVLGVKGTLGADKKTLASVGITCALCHSTVDDSFAPGIGKRLDGWPNRDLDVGAIIALAPDLSAISMLLGVDDATVRTVLASWGPGKFDAELLLDGKAFRPDGKTAATLLPPAYGLAGVNLHTYTGWGSVPYWNALVANLEMHGSGTFFDPRLDDATQFPVAARARLGHVKSADDRITGKLPALHAYQIALAAPRPAAGSFDAAAAARGQQLFVGAAKCAECHVPPLFTEPGWNLHPASDINIDDFQAQRSPTRQYRTTPLRGVSTHGKGGYYHDGRFATLREVVDHYDSFLGGGDPPSLGLTDAQKNDLVEYLKSL
jgi:hypothetical protein